MSELVDEHRERREGEQRSIGGEPPRLQRPARYSV
jgi:hypothetical protein